jgi:hypothetical protein
MLKRNFLASANDNGRLSGTSHATLTLPLLIIHHIILVVTTSIATSSAISRTNLSPPVLPLSLQIAAQKLVLVGITTQKTLTLLVIHAVRTSRPCLTAECTTGTSCLTAECATLTSRLSTETATETATLTTHRTSTEATAIQTTTTTCTHGTGT